MPPWLKLALFLVGLILFVGLEAAATTGRWRSFGQASGWMAKAIGACTVVGLALVAWFMAFPPTS
jgi:hypothetical protein